LDVCADPIGQAYEILESVYDGFDPDGSVGTLLENIAGLTGLTRKPATFSKTTLTVDVNIGTTLSIGDRARVPDGVIFALDTAVVGDGSGTQTVAATATTAGALEASAGSVTEIVDAQSGWVSVTNAADATTGTAIENDVTLRNRREETFTAGGSCVVQALRVALEELDYITSASVISNDTSATVNGIPPHSFRTVIYPTTAVATELTEIAETIWNHKPAGIQSYGTDNTGTVENVYGYQATVAWDWADTIEMHATLTLTTGSDYPSNGDTLVKAAVETWGDALGLGGDAYNADCQASVSAAVPGIQTYTVTQFKKTGGSYANTFVANAAEITQWDPSRVTVTST
jgi:hypothetical protein